MSDKITSPDAVRQAISEYDTLGRRQFLEKYGFREAIKYYIDYNGKLYDAKAILGVAHGYEFPELGPLKASEFRGDRYTVKRKFEILGFKIIEKREEILFEFDRQFQEIFKSYIPAKKDLDIRREIEKIFNSLKGAFDNLTVLKENTNIITKYGYAIGRMANVPWIAFLDNRVTDTPKKGIYCVYLFKSDMSGVYLTFNQGIGSGASDRPNKQDLINIHQQAIELRKICEDLTKIGFSLSDNITLADSGAGKGYEYSTIAHKLYTSNNFPTNDSLISDLEYLLEFYDSYVSEIPFSPPEIPPPKEEPPLEEEETMLMQERYTIEQFIEETGFTREDIENWRLILERKQQIVFQGPPGTGKTFVAERLAKLMVSETSGFWDVVQFHSAYSYEDFIQGYHPDIKDGKIIFRLKPGRFREFCKKAKITLESPCVLIIDEINRANLARVFGELMYLLEYREKAIPLAAGGVDFQIPTNVYLVGTMNTADRSIALVDHALRRRFSFVRLKPEYDILRKHIERLGLPADDLIRTLQDINNAIEDQNYEVGISFFMKDQTQLKEVLPTIWRSEIEPYLEEYFYDQPGKVEPFRWNNLSRNSMRSWVEVP